jgi:hypothetical protein
LFQTNLNLIERAKVGIRANAKLHPKAIGVNLRINKREMTPIIHRPPHLPHREYRGRKTRIGTIPSLRLLGPFGTRLYHRARETTLIHPTHTPLTVLTRGDVGVLQYTGENIRLYTRSDVRTAYNIIKPLTLPNQGVNLPSSELERVLHKSAEEISAYDNELANYVMDRIDESLTKTNAFAYEVMEGTAKHVVDIYNEKYPPHRRHEKGVLYTILPPSAIMSVGNYYSIFRQRPIAKSNNSYEYMLLV